MTTRPADILLDNPILVKHIRSRLRPGQLVPWLVVVVVLSLVIVWAGQVFQLFQNGAALAFLLGFQIIILGLSGGSQVASSAAGARESGIIEFHRISPLPPHWLTLGFFFGAPIREYILFAATLPVAVLLASMAPSGIGGLIQLIVPLIFGCWLIQALGLLGSLVSRKPRAKGGGGITGLVVLSIFLGQPIGQGLWYATNQLWGQTETLAFFGVPIHWMLFLSSYELVLLGWLLLASTRRMRADNAHSFTKREAILCLGSLTVLLLGGCWDLHEWDWLVLVVLYVLMVLAMTLTMTITPDQSEYVKGLRRALRMDQRRPSVWSDAGTNRLAVFALSAIVFLGATLTWEAIVGRPAGGAPKYSLTIAVGVFTVAYAGLARQFFSLRFPKTGTILLQLFLFFAWFLPLLVGSISAGAGMNDSGFRTILALSPWAGVAMSSEIVTQNVSDPVRLAAIAPAITFAFVFNFLLVATQRKIDLIVRSGARVASLSQEQQPEPADAIAEPAGESYA